MTFTKIACDTTEARTHTRAFQVFTVASSHGTAPILAANCDRPLSLSWEQRLLNNAGPLPSTEIPGQWPMSSVPEKIFARRRKINRPRARVRGPFAIVRSRR